MKMPSAESIRRSRRATSSMSPTSTPSTKIRPACSGWPNAGPLRVDLQRQPVLALEDALRLDADRLGQLGVQPDPLVVAVRREHVLRLREVEHQLELLGIAVPRRVDRRVARGQHVGAQVVQPVDGLVHGALVARDRGGGEHHGVAGVQVHVRVVAGGHPPQRRERLALAAGRDHHQLVVGVVLDLLGLHQHPLGHVDVAQPAADVHVLAHRAAHQRHLAAQRGGRVHHLLHAVDVRGEAGDHDPALAARERLLQPRAHQRLRQRPARAVGVGGVAAEHQQPLSAQLGKPRHVGRDAVDGGLIELVVAGHERACPARR